MSTTRSSTRAWPTASSRRSRRRCCCATGRRACQRRRAGALPALARGADGGCEWPFAYLSNSPWNLLGFLQAFLERHGPDGPLLLTDWGRAPPGLLRIGTRTHKLAARRRLAVELPRPPVRPARRQRSAGRGDLHRPCPRAPGTRRDRPPRRHARRVRATAPHRQRACPAGARRALRLRRRQRDHAPARARARAGLIPPGVRRAASGSSGRSGSSSASSSGRRARSPGTCASPGRALPSC